MCSKEELHPQLNAGEECIRTYAGTTEPSMRYLSVVIDWVAVSFVAIVS